MGIIAAGQITVVDLSDAPVLNTFITASRPTTQTYSKDSRTYKPSYASTPQVLTLKVTKGGSTANIIDSISSLHWFVVDGPIKTEITSKDNSANEYISGAHNEILTTKLDIDLNKGSKRYEVMGIWPDPSTGLDVQFGGYIDLLLTQNGATGPQGPQGDTGNGIANTVITYGLSMSDTTEPATWSSERPALVKGMYLWTRTVIIYTNGSSTTSYQISYIAKDADATAEIDKTKQELLEKLETVRDESLAAVDEAKHQLVTVRDESLAAAEEAKQGLTNVNTKVDNAKAEIDKAKQDLTNVASELNTAKQDLADSVSAVNTKVDNAKEELTQAKQQLTTVADDLSTAKQDFQNAVSAVDTKATNLKSDLAQAKQDLASQAQQLQEQAGAQSELTKRVSSVEKTANGTKTTVGELSKTVAQNGKDITSVTARTKVVEDDLAGTKTTLSQVQTTANTTSQKTATLETGLNGLNAKFETLKIGSRNYFKDSKSRKYYINDVGTQDVRTCIDDDFWQNDTRFTKDYVRMSFDIAFNPALPSNFTTNVYFSASPWYNCGGITFKGGTTDLQHFDLKFNLSGASKSYKTDNVFIRLNNTLPLNTAVSLENFNLYLSAVVEDYSPNDADLKQKVAEYKQNADQNYASLQTTVQNLDGTVQHNKTVADQTAQGFTTRIESLETYKDGETTRANQYFELARTETARQLSVERTAIAKNYVAKSTYTSDVTGIRNDLSATTSTANTTKTNLANYQASNDRAVANLQSNLQTANGNISSLKTKVEAVPGQITSAVSAVESKIPTEIGAVNLLKNSKSFIGSNITGVSTLLNETYQGCAVRYFKNTNPNSNLQDYAQYLSCVVPKSEGEYTVSFWAKGSGTTRVFFYNGLSVGNFVTSQGLSENRVDGRATFTLSENWQRYWVKYKLRATTEQQTVAKNLLFRHDNNSIEDEIWLAGVQLEEGNVVSGYEPAPEDTAEQISSLSSEIKQTADGMTLLATKTELNTAKSDLQSGINTATNKANAAQNTANNNAQTISTHTTQISALNTGLQAKVSQTDFNTLSGRVTTAENNITAKANELSSKITSVEGKIPTSIGGRNLYALSQNSPIGSNHITNFKQDLKTGEISFKVSGRDPFFGNVAMKDEAVGTWRGVKIPVKTGQGIAVWVTNPILTKNFVSYFGNNDRAVKNYKGYPTNKFVIPASELAGVSYVTFRFGIQDDTQEVGSVHSTKVKVEYGNVYTDWSPAPEDTAEQISSLSSELKQTADGITLLATKTELNTAKSDLQSGINTATNKANAAQNTANNNAQTISTHTTQISALNTGLQAKVSQTDFNTLSGRVTTAENNITAKANELSSKITSVEGKIPTSVGGRNLLAKTNQGKTNWAWSISSGGATAEDCNVDGVKAVKLSRTTNTSASWHFIQYQGLIRNLIEPNTKYTLSFDVKPNVDVTFSAILMRGNGTGNLTNTVNMNKALANKWTKVSCVLTSNTTLSSDTSQVVYLQGMPITNGNWLIIKNIKLEKGAVSSDWSPAPEDTTEQINAVSSELKQTKDGITLLATKTELNTAKSDLQSGINTATNKANAAQNTANSAQNKANSNAQTISTHTTQISALNTGLQAKVSQTDFNTLSGRVTTAENNITAKANELSSKITSVEGKIPTEIGSVNLLHNSKGPFQPKNSRIDNYTVYQNTWIDMEQGKEYTLSAKGTAPFTSKHATDKEKNEICLWLVKHDENINVDRIISNATTGTAGTTFTWNDPSGKYRLRVNTYKIDNSNYVEEVQIERGNVATDWSPAPEDTISQINAVSSELKQTKDGITLLATKTELNTAKNELQSGINTATNKANAAQSTANSAQNKANSNAQTISTHTTQISALNTGLSAKVSQSDFNTLSGRVTTAENNITAKANELSSKITSVEGKIPTSVGGTNLLLYTADPWKAPSGYYQFSGAVKTNDELNGSVVYKTNTAWNSLRSNWGKHLIDRKNVKVGDEFTYSIYAKTDQTSIRTRLFIRYSGQSNAEALSNEITLTNEWKKLSVTFKVTQKMVASQTKVSWVGFEQTSNSENGKFVYYACNKLERGNIATDYSPAPEDTIEEISSLTSQIQQTKDGITLLATKTELNSAKTDLQSGINTATNKANAAQNTANNAQNKANSNAQTISTHTTQISALNTGLQAKVSQSDFNTLSGRVTTAENNITAKANELSSKITSVEGKIPSGEMNLVEYGRPVEGYNRYTGAEYATHPYYYNGAFKMYIIKNTTTSEKVFGMNRFKVERNTEYTLYFKGFNNSAITNMDVWFLKRVKGSTKDWDSAQQLVIGRKLSSGAAENISVTFNTGNYDEGYLRFDNNGTTTAGTQADLYFGDVSVKKGKSNNGWSPSLAELASSQDLKNAQSEIKQTTDSIKASVSSLDQSTIKTSSLTINSDGIVMKAGKSTTDVANAIGSYFAVNQNAINLFSDKINVKGSMIVNGTITGDKIKASSVDVSKISGLDANFIKSKIEYAMIDWLKGKTITAYNGNMTIDLQNGRISFKDGSNAVYRQTSDGIHTGFLHFEAGAQGGVYAAFGTTSTRQGINSKSSEFAGIRCYRVSANGDSHDAKIDKIEVIGDTVQFGHTYHPNGTIGGGFIMQTAAYYDDPPYSLNRMVSSIESLWRTLYVHGANVGYNLSHPNFINALRDEYNAWHDMHNR